MYKFGFNGKIKDDEITGVTGSFYDYGMREYNSQICRFISIDPLHSKYPELTPYQFASNRPIDGIDQDGLEYATYTIYVQYGKVKDIKITKDYELKDKNTLGPGILYNTVYLDNDGKMIKFDTKMVENKYGIYYGDKNPQSPDIGGDPNKLHDDYTLAPINETDDAAKQHDIDFDNAGKLKGIQGVFDNRSTPANESFIKKADKIIDKYNNKQKDDITGKPVTAKAKDAASKAKIFFKSAEAIKSKRNAVKKFDDGGSANPAL